MAGATNIRTVTRIQSLPPWCCNGCSRHLAALAAAPPDLPDLKDNSADSQPRSVREQMERIGETRCRFSVGWTRYASRSKTSTPSGSGRTVARLRSMLRFSPDCTDFTEGRAAQLLLSPDRISPYLRRKKFWPTRLAVGANITICSGPQDRERGTGNIPLVSLITGRPERAFTMIVVRTRRLNPSSLRDRG